MHLERNICGGMGDVYYVCAVTIKKLVDSRDDAEKYMKVQEDAHSTLITLLFDSGLIDEAEIHLQKALELNEGNPILLIRSVLMTPTIFRSQEHLESTRSILEDRVDRLRRNETFQLPLIDEFTLSPTFYYAYQGFNNRDILVDIRGIYASAFRKLNSVLISPKVNSPENAGRKINIGFVSSYFRQHSVCKLFCGVIAGLDRNIFDVTIFSSTEERSADAFTEALRAANTTFLSTGKTLIDNREMVTSRNIDVLVYLDIGMEASVVVWAQARLAPVQVLKRNRSQLI